MIALRTLGWTTPVILEIGGAVQEIALGAALFGLGAAVRLRELLHAGAPAFVMALCSWALIAGLGLAAVYAIAWV